MYVHSTILFSLHVAIYACATSPFCFCCGMCCVKVLLVYNTSFIAHRIHAHALIDTHYYSSSSSVASGNEANDGQTNPHCTRTKYKYNRRNDRNTDTGPKMSSQINLQPDSACNQHWFRNTVIHEKPGHSTHL